MTERSPQHIDLTNFARKGIIVGMLQVIGIWLTFQVVDLSAHLPWYFGLPVVVAFVFAIGELTDRFILFPMADKMLADGWRRAVDRHA